MKKFRWNDEKQLDFFWSPVEMKDFELTRSDAQIVRAPKSVKMDTVLLAVCRVLAELIDLEEERAEK